MDKKQFVTKWKEIDLKEIAIAQSHFIDVCSLVDHKSPTDADPKGEYFTFEMAAEKPNGESGRADAWYKGKFIWEYKRPGSNLNTAYNQLLLYRESLGNPPLLITSDTHDIIIHTNFTNTVKKVFLVDFESILNGDGLDLLKRAFSDPNSFQPKETQEYVTAATANTFIDVANVIQEWARVEGHKNDPERLAHFITRLLFTLFSEDMGLLPENLLTKIVEQYKEGTVTHLAGFVTSLHQLFATMRVGGTYGFYKIPYFDGNLFDDDFIPDLPTDIIHKLKEACTQDWSNIDPSIFGTLFERIIDTSKRAQLGAHYTNKDDISLIVEPVLIEPLKNKWQLIKQQGRDLLKQNKPDQAYKILETFANDIAHIRILDPACGSGNFLYIALRRLLDLQKEVITFCGQNNLPSLPLTVNPSQLYGIELNPYAHELAQITVWIGYLQWKFFNGFSDIGEPILRPLHNIEKKDAIITNYENNPVEPEWPEVDIILGNPPFLGGGRRMREELGDQYVDRLFDLYRERVPGGADLVCYWFEKARAMLKAGRAKRVGLLATQSIRGGTNRQVLERIKNTGNIFMAWSDRKWIQEGVMVHVSMIGFDSGQETNINLNGQVVDKINSDLTNTLDVTIAKHLKENDNICFKGIDKSGDFELTFKQAQSMREAKNASGLSNSNIIKPYINALDITQRSRNIFIIDFTGLQKDEAAKYEEPFKYILENVKPHRDKVRRETRKAKWWLFGETRPGLINAISPLKRFIATPLTSKHRLYVWLSHAVLSDQANFIFARDDDYFFGVLHSSVHEIWVRRKGTQLREAESGSRYSPTETFETYPFPWVLGQEPKQLENPQYIIYKAIEDQAHKLDDFRNVWLNPEGIGVTFSQSTADKRTLTNLYNALDHYRADFKSIEHDKKKWDKDVDNIISLDEIEELDYIHNELDKAVFAAYGWNYPLSEEQILHKLLALNLQRAQVVDK